jgi:hypothetical protein
MIVLAGASQQFDPQAYSKFLDATASDSRFNVSEMMAEIGKMTTLSWFESATYRLVLIPAVKRGLLEHAQKFTWMSSRPVWGKGRIDPQNPFKFTTLAQPIDQTIGNSDMVPLWNLAKHDGWALHWDGLTTSLQESVISSAIGDGTTAKWVDRDFKNWNSTDPKEMSSLRRVMNYISKVQAPAYPYPIDQALAAAGKPIYQQYCAECHDIGAKRTGTVIPVAEVGTDRHRLDMWTKGSADAYNAYGVGHDWRLSKFRKTDGYASVSLEGLWLRAPYLHNGSVPSLTDLLEPVDSRPKGFWRGYDLYDPVKVGFVTSGADAERVGTYYDVARPGNSNIGHTYGTTLAAQEKKALLEFMNTL